MKIKNITILTLVFAMMIAMVGVVAAQDGTDGERERRGGRGFFGASEIITGATEMTQEEIREALRNGETLAQLIEDNDEDVDAVIADLVEEATNHINEKVAAGDITQERADEKLATLEERITDRINGTFERPERDGRRGRGGFGDNTPEDTSDDV